MRIKSSGKKPGACRRATPQSGSRVPSIRPDRRAPQLVAAASAPSPAGVDEHEDDDEDGESDERSTDPERLTRETHLLTSFAKEYEAKCSAVSVVAYLRLGRSQNAYTDHEALFIHNRLESGTLGTWDGSKGGPCVDPVDHPDCGSRIGSTRFSRVPIDAQMRGRSASRPSEAC
jgi:hypothetical protein